MKLFKSTLLAATTALVPAGAMAQDETTPNFCTNAFFPGDTNEDGMIDEGEVNELASAVFSELDLNEDGAIDREEYAACTSQRTQSMASSSAEQDWMTLDSNQDDMVSAGEFFDGAERTYSDIFSDAGDNSDMATTLDEPFIALADDGSEDSVDLQDRDVYSGLAARTFSNADANDDMQLTRDEWMDRAEDHEADISQTNQRFGEIDQSSDDRLTEEEFTANYRDILGQAQGNADRDGFTDQSKGIPVYYFYIETM